MEQMVTRQVVEAYLLSMQTDLPTHQISVAVVKS